jgi:hypothetical protein
MRNTETLPSAKTVATAWPPDLGGWLEPELRRQGGYPLAHRDRSTP